MSQLIKYEAACRALAECKAVDEVKVWADKAAAMQAYGRMAKDKTLEVDAAEIRLRAERRLGELIAAQKASGGLNRGARVAGNKPGAGQASPAVVTDDRRSKLADAGISKDLSSRAQKLAAVPEAEFEAEVGEWRERVSAEGARVSARLEAAGEREQKKTPKPKAEPAQPTLEASAGDADDFGPTPEELAAQEREEAEERAAMQRLLDADDKLAHLDAENKKLRALNRVLEERINGLLAEKAAAVSSAKKWQRKCEAAERRMKESA